MLALAIAPTGRGFEKSSIGNNAPGAANEKGQYFKLRWRQFDRLTAARDAVIEDLYRQGSATTDWFLTLGFKVWTKQRADACQ